MKKSNLKIIVKRITAYIIDIMLVTIIASLVTCIPVFNKEYEKYQKIYDEYQDIYNEYTNIIVLINDSYKDKKIDSEEYTKLLEAETYKTIIEEKYDDEIIDEDEYEDIKKFIDDKYLTIANDYNYKLQKIGIYNSIVTLACTLLYFGVLQYFLKGQTIGKKIMSLKVISITSDKLNIFTYILRSLIVNNVFLNGVNVSILAFTSREIFTKANNIISFLISLIEAIIIFLVITREDHRGLHDLLLKTQVVSTKEDN